MKNIHILPTDNYSPLVNITGRYGGLLLSKYYYPIKYMGDSYQNIYITSDEEIKEGEWGLDLCEDLGLKYQPFKVDKATLKYANQECKKIILTTDQDIIKDGVHSIDDDCLEWFIKNPSCARVVVSKNSHTAIEEISYEGDFQNVDYNFYKIIIPKEKPKQETLEEAARIWNESFDEYDEFVKKHNTNIQNSFIAGAQWQQERSYSKKDLISFAFFYFKEEFNSVFEDPKSIEEIFILWFEQFKKK